MTAKEMSTLIGASGTYWVKEMDFEIQILDVQAHYGRIDVEITPIAGKGSAWVSLGSVRVTS